MLISNLSGLEGCGINRIHDTIQLIVFNLQPAVHRSGFFNMEETMNKTMTIIAGAMLLSSTDADAAKQCILCPPGKYSDSTMGGVCKTCPAGSYCMQEIKFGCPAGMYGDQPGQMDRFVCRECSVLVSDGTNGKHTFCPSISGASIESGCFNSILGGQYAYSGHFGDTPTGIGYCHCRANSNGVWSSWVFFGDTNNNYGGAGCFAGCRLICQIHANLWTPGARWKL
jgi:hypothetical protein